MPRGYWGIFVALVGCLILAAAKAGPQHNTGIGNQAAEQRQQAPAPPAPAPERYRPYSDYNQNDCYRDTNHDAADLCAQWRAALAAEKAAEWSRRGVFVAIGGALLSFASVILVLMALRQGREANRINMKEAGRNTRRAVASARDTEAALAVAGRNADAATAQVEVAREMHTAQTRPWVFVKEVQIVYETTKKANLVLYFHNYGNWPATNFAKTIYARHLPYPFAATPLEEPDGALATVLPPSSSESMVAENLPAPKAGYMTRLDIAWSYALPDGSKETAYESFVVDVSMGKLGVRKMTAYDSANHSTNAKERDEEGA